MSEEKVVKAYSTVNEEELLVIKSLLEDADIQYYVKGEEGRAIYGIMQGMFNEMHVYVNEEDLEDVEKIIAVMKQPAEVSIGNVNNEESPEAWEDDCGCQAREE